MLRCSVATAGWGAMSVWKIGCGRYARAVWRDADDGRQMQRSNRNLLTPLRPYCN